MTDPSRIRNFSIVAHIDHGKTTLSDRILEITGALTAREMTEQVLDDNPIEKERGITIKARSVTLKYRAEDGADYVLNLIDTPGHVDFTYEVSRSLAACEGAVLVVDATQGVEAQTLANAYLAIHNDLTIVPCINKVDLPSAVPEMAREQIEEVIGIPARHAVLTSGKVGTGVRELLEQIVHDIPAPKGDPAAPLKALLFDSWFDVYRGVTCLVRVHEGTLKPGMKIRMMGTGLGGEVQEVGIFNPKPLVVPELSVGEVGYVIAGIKDLHAAKIGDTVTEVERPTARGAAGLPGRQADGLRVDLPDGDRGVRGPARRDGEAPAERRVLHVRARVLDGPRLRVPLRVPRPPPHGDHPGAPRARVRTSRSSRRRRRSPIGSRRRAARSSRSRTP